MNNNIFVVNWGLIVAGEFLVMLFLLSAYLLTTQTRRKNV